MVDVPPPSPLTGEAKRRAFSTNAGFKFQYWLSVLTWLKLNDSDLLVIEGVEDIDRIGSDRADLTQAKRYTGELRLSTKEAAVAIGNYLIAAAKNGDYELYLSYVTTASAGIEPRTTFKTDPRGIVVWGNCAEAESFSLELQHDLAQLPDLVRRPLARRAQDSVATAATSQNMIPENEDPSVPLRNEDRALQYLDSHTSGIDSDRFLQSIVKRIRWDVSSPDTPAILERVCNALTLYADTIEVRPQTLQECRFRLLSRVLDAASGLNDGCLTKAELDAEIALFLESLGLGEELSVSAEIQAQAST